MFQVSAMPMAARLMVLFLLLQCPHSMADQDESQKEIARDMIRVLNAYVVYKMGQYDDAFDQYLSLAEEGSRQGMLNVANMYAQGQGVEQSDDRAFYWYQRSAEDGDVISMVEVARAYDSGRGVQRDTAKAWEWLLRAATAGSEDAQWEIGRRLYDQGNQPDGLCWIKLAAVEGGQPAAQQFLSGLDEEPSARPRISETCPQD
jgi:uncharacterized protein